MIKIGNITYLTTKEVAYRYGVSVGWVKRQRTLNKRPNYYKHADMGKVLYPLTETDNWFEKNLIRY